MRQAKLNHTITCGRCGNPFEAARITRKWCDDCAEKRYLDKPPISRTCKLQGCGVEILIPRGSKKTDVRNYCCDEHAVEGARISRRESKNRMGRGEPKRWGRPNVLEPEEAKKRKKQGLADRWFRNHPHRSRVCEARDCGEDRVVELAHKKPRNGAWPSLSRNTRDEDVWVLCPTCHRVLDRGIETAEELGLT